MNSEFLTIPEVKRVLPDVTVRWMGELWYARTSGRLNQFASVSPYRKVKQPGKLIATILGPVFHFSWDAVLRGANGTVLSCE